MPELRMEKSKKVKEVTEYIIQIYGEPKAGKSTFASNFPDAYFICTEPGHKFLEVYGGDIIHKDWNEVKDTCRHLAKGDHPFKTIVFDTVDNAHEFCSKHVNKTRGIEHESDEGFGKGWAAVQKEFKLVINTLANRGYGVVFISHVSQTERTTKGMKHSYLDNSLSGKARKFINGLSDVILYAHSNDNGDRFLRTKASTTVNAGDRSGLLPEIIEMDYKVFEKGMKGKK